MYGMEDSEDEDEEDDEEAPQAVPLGGKHTMNGKVSLMLRHWVRPDQCMPASAVV
jgi:hypothetical protein